MRYNRTITAVLAAAGLAAGLGLSACGTTPPAWCGQAERIVNADTLTQENDGTDYMLSAMAQAWPNIPPSPLLVRFSKDVSTLGLAAVTPGTLASPGTIGTVGFKNGRLVSYPHTSATNGPAHRVMNDLQGISNTCTG